MRSTVVLALVTSLIGSVHPVAAQQNTPIGGPIARAIAREAARQPTVQQSGPAESEWPRVRKLAPGTELIVTVKRSQPADRYLVQAGDSDLTVLNLSAPALPTAARDVLRHVASTHPEYMLAAKKGGRFGFEKNVRMGPDGVFVADRKIADLANVVEEYNRDDITEIKTAETESNPVACTLAGYYGGGVVGGIPGAIIGGAVGRDTGPALVGMTVGWSIGAVYLYRKCRHTPEKVIYCAS